MKNDLVSTVFNNKVWSEVCSIIVTNNPFCKLKFEKSDIQKWTLKTFFRVTAVFLVFIF